MQRLFLLLSALLVSSARAEDVKFDELPDFKTALVEAPLDLSAGFAIGALRTNEQSFLRPSALIGITLLPTWWISPYVDFRVGNVTLGYEGQLSPNATLSSEFRKNGFATVTVGATAVVYRYRRVRLHLFGEYERNGSGTNVSVENLRANVDGKPIMLKPLLNADDEFALRWRHWMAGASVRVRLRRTERVAGTLMLGIAGHSTSIDVNLSPKTAGLLTLFGKSASDVEKMNGKSEVRPVLMPGIEVECTPWLRWAAEGVFVPLLHGDGFAYGANTKFIFRP